MCVAFPFLAQPVPDPSVRLNACRHLPQARLLQPDKPPKPHVPCASDPGCHLQAAELSFGSNEPEKQATVSEGPGLSGMQGNSRLGSNAGAGSSRGWHTVSQQAGSAHSTPRLLGGESYALQYLAAFVTAQHALGSAVGQLRSAAEGVLAQAACFPGHLGPWLMLGCLSPRQVGFEALGVRGYLAVVRGA